LAPIEALRQSHQARSGTRSCRIAEVAALLLHPVAHGRAQHKLPVVFVVVRNGEYGVLKDFAVFEEAPNVPGLDLPGLDIPSIAKVFGCQAVVAKSKPELSEAFVAALGAGSPTVITVLVKPEIRPLI
jgi:benzoylformate decarboxylase